MYPGLERFTLLIVGHKAHAVGVKRQRLCTMHDQVVVAIKCNLMYAQQDQAAAAVGKLQARRSRLLLLSGPMRSRVWQRAA